MRIVGLDPGLRFTGWGCVRIDSGGVVVYEGHGVIAVPLALPLPQRLSLLFQTLSEILADLHPDGVTVEEVFVNRNGASTVKLCMARGVVMMAPARLGIPVFEYGANCIKKTVTGNGHADKAQIKTMVEFLLPKFRLAQQGQPCKADCSDALAAALCHAQHISLEQAQQRALG